MKSLVYSLTMLFLVHTNTAVAQDVDCSGDNNEIRIEDYDEQTRTFEVIDTLCDGQGPFYSTPEAIGKVVPVLWMKSDPKLFLNKTFFIEGPLEFHPTRELAVIERESFSQSKQGRFIRRPVPGPTQREPDNDSSGVPKKHPRKTK